MTKRSRFEAGVRAGLVEVLSEDRVYAGEIPAHATRGDKWPPHAKYSFEGSGLEDQPLDANVAPTVVYGIEIHARDRSTVLELMDLAAPAVVVQADAWVELAAEQRIDESGWAVSLTAQSL